MPSAAIDYTKTQRGVTHEKISDVFDGSVLCGCYRNDMTWKPGDRRTRFLGTAS